MKILQGSLKETLYKPMAGGEEMKGSGCPPTVMQETIYHLDDVAYISGMPSNDRSVRRLRDTDGIDKHGPHKIVNPDRHDYAVSLHRESTSQFMMRDFADHLSLFTSCRVLQCVRREDR